MVNYSQAVVLRRTCAINSQKQAVIPIDDLQLSAILVRSALVTLRGELSTPSPAVALAMDIIASIITDIEAGRNPLDRPDDWTERTRWPQWPHWDRMAWAITMLAGACGTQAQCSQKYEYLNVRLADLGNCCAALHEIAELIELASDYEDTVGE